MYNRITEWVSVDDFTPELPDNVDSDEFLIAWTPISKTGRQRPRHFYQIATWDKFEKDWHFNKGAFKKDKIKVLAWMDLPEQFEEY